MTVPLSLVLIGALAALPLRAPKDTHTGKPMRVHRVSPAPPMPIPPTPEQVERLHARLAERRMREVQSHVRRDVMVFETPKESGDYLYIVKQGRAGTLLPLATVAGGVRLALVIDPRTEVRCYRSNTVTRAVTLATMKGQIQ